MSIVDDAGEVAVALGLEYEAMTMRPKDGTVRFVVAGAEVVLTFDELAREAAQARAARQAAGRPVPHAALRFEYPSPIPSGRR